MTTLATRARLTVVAAIAAVMMVVGAAAPALADTTDDLMKVDSTLSSAVNAFSAVYSDQSAALDSVVAAAKTFKTAAETAQSDFSSAAKGASDSTIAGFAKDLSGEAGDMASAADALATAFTNQDQSAAQKGESDMNAALDSYGKTVDKYNEYLKTAGDPTYIVWLIILIVAVVFLVLALVLALVTRKQQGLLEPKADKKGNVSQSSLKKMRWAIVAWAALFVVGAAIPFFQVLNAQPDSSGQYRYNIFWYPLAAGAILTVVSSIQYFIAASKVKKQGSALAFDPADPATHGALAQGMNYQQVPDAAAQGAAYPPVPTADATAPAAPEAVAPEAVAPEAVVPAAEAATAVAPEAAPADPAAPEAPQA